MLSIQYIEQKIIKYSEILHVSQKEIDKPSSLRCELNALYGSIILYFSIYFVLSALVILVFDDWEMKASLKQTGKYETHMQQWKKGKRTLKRHKEDGFCEIISQIHMETQKNACDIKTLKRKKNNHFQRIFRIGM